MMPKKLQEIEARLEKGDAMCRTMHGPELDRLNQFWLNLLKEYERAYREWRDAQTR